MPSAVMEVVGHSESLSDQAGESLAQGVALLRWRWWRSSRQMG